MFVPLIVGLISLYLSKYCRKQGKKNYLLYQAFGVILIIIGLIAAFLAINSLILFKIPGLN